MSLPSSTQSCESLRLRAANDNGDGPNEISVAVSDLVVLLGRAYAIRVRPDRRHSSPLN